MFLEQDEKDKFGLGCDLWALACTIFEIRTGRRKLFAVVEKH